MVQTKPSRLQNLSNLPTLGPGDSIGEGDSFIVHDLIPWSLTDSNHSTTPLQNDIFNLLKSEVEWQKMYHAAGEVPRLVAVQGVVGEDGSKPVYRHPADQSPPLKPFTRIVNVVRKEAEKSVGHELNHVLIQMYRDGKDHITEHSDKTLDIVKGTMIVNASFGARRTMRLRGKRKPAITVAEQPEVAEAALLEVKEADAARVAPDAKDKPTTVSRTRDTQRVHMPHNSLFVLGPLTNTNWLHGISPDKRLPVDRDPAELAFESARISLTFRQIGTFLDVDEKKIWGQGAVHKKKEEAADAIVGDEGETERMIKAFGKENREDTESGWDWNATYGGGFDVLHFRS